jgi:hypothetical protein
MNPRDPFQELQDALSFPTSPDFRARVRQQLAMPPARSRFSANAGVAMAAGLILAAGAGVLILRDQTVEPRTAQLASVEPPMIRSTVPQTTSPLAPVSRASVPQVFRSAAPQVASPAAVQASSPFETLVPDDQLRALDHLLSAMRTGRATVPAEVVAEEVNDLGQRVLKALVIEPMKVEPLPGTPGEPNKDPVKDPIK